MRMSGNGGNPSRSAVAKAISGLSARVPYNNQVAVFGDSIAYNNTFNVGGTYMRYFSKGYINWAACFGRQRWTFDHADNYGWPGRNTREALAPAQGVNGNFPVADVAPIDIFVSRKPVASTVIVDIGTNDEPNGVPLAETKTNLMTIINKILAMGKIVVLITPRPRDITASGLTMTAAQYRQHLARRDWYMGLHSPGSGIYVVDMWRYMADPASTNGAPKAGHTYDGLHPGTLGAFWNGKALAELLGEGRGPGLIPFRDVMVAQNTDIYNAADYPRGCLNSNPMLAGGTTAATNYTVSGGAGVTNTGSKVTSGDRADVQQCVLGGTASGNADFYEFQKNDMTANLTIGDTIRAMADIEHDGVSGLSAHGLVLVDTSDFNKGAGFLIDDGNVNTQGAIAIPAFSGVLRTPPFTLASTSLRLAMKGRAISGQAVAGTYRLRALAVRKEA